VVDLGDIVQDNSREDQTRTGGGAQNSRTCLEGRGSPHPVNFLVKFNPSFMPPLTSPDELAKRTRDGFFIHPGYKRSSYKTDFVNFLVKFRFSPASIFYFDFNDGISIGIR
jgi:hypothetical protein